MSLFAMLVVGLIAGWLASKIMKTNTSLLTELILGVVGAVLGGWISSLLLGVNLVGAINLTSILVALLGSILVIFIYRLIKRR